MIGYLIAWILYLTASVFLLKVYRRSFVFWLPASWRSVSVLLLAVMLLTPFAMHSTRGRSHELPSRGPA